MLIKRSKTFIIYCFQCGWDRIKRVSHCKSLISFMKRSTCNMGIGYRICWLLILVCLTNARFVPEGTGSNDPVVDPISVPEHADSNNPVVDDISVPEDAGSNDPVAELDDITDEIEAAIAALNETIDDPIEINSHHTTSEVHQVHHTENKEEGEENEIAAFDRIAEVNMESHADNYLKEGDMLLSNLQIKELETGENYQGDLTPNKANHWDYKGGASGKWKSTVYIPYEMRTSSSPVVGAINAAIRHYNEKTCVRFIRRTNQPNYVSVFVGGGCYSYVGMTGGRQDLSLGRGCEYMGIAIHEMMHAIGYFHEQSRPDRDKYVEIITRNIPAGVRYNFNKMPKLDTQNTIYDYGSIMHYGETAFGSGRVTIRRKDGGKGLGQRNGLSDTDIQGIAKLYCGVDTTGTKTTTTPKPTPTPTPVTPKPPTGNCNLPSSAEFCNKVAANDMCKYCAMAKSCSTTCRNKNSNCPRWARAGFCTRTYVRYMTRNCVLSCACN